MNRLLTSALVSLSLLACGPDAVANLGDDGADDAVEVFEGELTSTSRSQTWFPLANGNEWTFTSSTGTTRTVKMTQVEDGMGLVTGLFPSPTWVGITSPSATTMYLWNGQAWLPWLRFGYARSQWKTSTAVCSGLIGERTATGTVITTEAGSFSDTRVIGFSPISSPTVRCAPAPVYELSFQAGLGLIGFRTGQGDVFTLTRAVVAGKVTPAPQAASVSAKVSLDQADYVSYPNTIQCITTPCPSNAQTATAKVTFELRNTSSTAQSWQFSTGCQFDVELVSSTGRIVRRLSDDRMCTYALTSLTLNPGQSRSYTANLELADATGLQLDGTYTVRARLIPSGNPALVPSATSSLKVAVLAP
jgi:hypothetical protein